MTIDIPDSLLVLFYDMAISKEIHITKVKTENSPKTYYLGTPLNRMAAPSEVEVIQNFINLHMLKKSKVDPGSYALTEDMSSWFLMVKEALSKKDKGLATI